MAKKSRKQKKEFQKCNDDETVVVHKKRKGNGHTGHDSPSPSQQSRTVLSATDATEALNDLTHACPVLILAHSGGKATAPHIKVTSSSLLADLFYPLPVESFLSQCLRQKAVFVSSDNKHRAKDVGDNYLFGLDVRQIFQQTSSDAIFFWLKHNSPSKEKNGNLLPKDAAKSSQHDDKTTASAAGRINSVELSDPETAYHLHQTSHHASYCRAPPTLEQVLVSSMLQSTTLGCGQYDPSNEKQLTFGRGEVEVFIGTTKHHVTDWHYDFQENFTIQLSGCKRWTLQQGLVQNPMRGCTPHYRHNGNVMEDQLKSARISNPSFMYTDAPSSSNSFGDQSSVVLNAGDVLYFPAGMWHKVETLEPGISINISLMARTYASIVCQSLQHLLLMDARWRESISDFPLHGRRKGGCMERLKELFDDLPTTVKKLSDDMEGIVPPLLRFPPSTPTHCEDDDRVETGNSDDEDDERMSDNSSVLSGMDHIVDIYDFQGPPGWDCHQKFSLDNTTHRLTKNPLASMIPMKELSSTTTTTEDERYYVLNVCFAGGNETNESLVRVVLKDDGRNNNDDNEKDDKERTFILRACYECELRNEDPAMLFTDWNASTNNTLDSTTTTSQNSNTTDRCRCWDGRIRRSPPPSLFYHGYFLWVERF